MSQEIRHRSVRVAPPQPAKPAGPPARLRRERTSHMFPLPPKNRIVRMVQLFLKEPSALEEALSSFTVLKDSSYANKHLGSSGQLEIMACECGHEQFRARRKSRKRASSRAGSSSGSDVGSDHESEHESERGSDGSANDADGVLCGPDSNCINRLTYMECFGEHCGCPDSCGNRRFQNYEYAPIDIFKAGKKGYGVRAMEDIPRGSFIFEYTGEVLDEARFVRRQQKYEREGVKHFYFMMLQKDEYIDATEKGSIARFCNHSCNPNAAIEKWVVGPKLRMGLFAKRDIARGEEICFDYKVDRFGSKAQPCYCGEQNCSGFLGGRTQTGGALLPPSVIEGLGLDFEAAFAWPERALQRLLQSELDLERVLKHHHLSAPSPRADGSPVAARRLSGSPSPSPPSPPAPPAPLGQPAGSDGLEQSSTPRNSRPEPASVPGSPRRPLPPPVMPLSESTRPPTEDCASTASSARTSSAESSGRPSAKPEPPARPPSAQSRLPEKSTSSTASKRKLATELVAVLDSSEASLRDAREVLLDSFPMIPLRLDDLPEFMRILMQAGDRAWLIRLMLTRVVSTAEMSVQFGILKMHGYEIMGTVMNRWRKFEDVLGAGLAVLRKWPKVTRNKISSSQIEAVVRDIRDAQAENPELQAQASGLLSEWSGLSMGYRIPRRKTPDVKPPQQSQKPQQSQSQNNLEQPQQTQTVEAPVATAVFPTKIDKRADIRRAQELERESHIRRAEQEQERQRQLALAREREIQQSEIQRIIDEATAAAGAITPPASTPSSANHAQSHAGSNAGNSAGPANASHGFETIFAAYVPKLVFVYQTELGRDRCKRHARDIVHALAKKEVSKGAKPAGYELTKDRKNRIKGFVKEYMQKVVSRHQKKPAAEPANKRPRQESHA